MIRLFYLLLCLAPLFPAPAAAQDGFFIESIVIQGANARSQSVLYAALQLDEGKSYTEADLQLAIYRLKALRFVLEADMRLERGTQRGAYRLVVRISESKRYFYVIFSELGVTREDYLEAEDSREPSVDQDTGTRISGLALGRRWFPGKNAELNLFLPFSPGISYTHYNLFNRNVVGSLALQYPGGFGKNFSSYPEEGLLTRVNVADSLSVNFSMGMLLTPRQWLSLNYRLNAGTIEETRPALTEPIAHEGTNFRNHKVELAWSYDSKDHPLFPLSGNDIRSGLQFDREFRNAANDDPNVPYDWLEANNYFYYVSGQKYWNYRTDHTLAFGLGARWGKANLSLTSADPLFQPAPDYRTAKYTLRGLYARNLLGVRFLGKERDFRLEAEAQWDEVSGNLENVLPPSDFSRIQLRLGIVGRDNYGLVRLSLVYRTHNEELWQ